MIEASTKWCYGYPLLSIIIKGVIDVFLVAFLLPFVTMPFWMTFLMVEHGPSIGLLLVIPVAFWGSLLGISIGTILLNTMPSICVTQTHLEVRYFYVWWVSIPWVDVVEIRRSRMPSNNIWVVIVKKMTPLHYVFGWQFARIFRPAVVIPPTIQHCDELLRDIRRLSGAIIVD